MGLKTTPFTLGGKWTHKVNFQTERWKHNIKVHILKCSSISNAGLFRHLGGVDPGKPTVRKGFLEEDDLRDLTKVTREVSNRTKTVAQTLLPPV